MEGADLDLLAPSEDEDAEISEADGPRRMGDAGPQHTVAMPQSRKEW